MHIWSICAFDQMCCVFGQLRKSNPNSEANPNPNPNPNASVLCDCPNIAQFIKCCAIDKLIRGAAWVKVRFSVPNSYDNYRP